MKRIASLLRLAAVVALAAAPASAAPLAAWVEMTSGGAELRLVTAATACPTATVDGAPRPMTERAGPDEAFDNRVCTAPLRPGKHAVTADGTTLAAPAARPARLVIIGDTGCRMKGVVFQGCNDGSDWPFPRVAALAAARRPDLVIHLGDYYYREIPCPRWARRCAGSPYGDRWATWKAEVFDPAAPLLAAAPWVFARGNHETCDRGGGGWFRMLDGAAPATACLARSPTFSVDIGGPVMWVVDGSNLEDFEPKSAKVAAWSETVRPALHGRHGWIVTHRPVWNPSRLGDLLGDGLINATERQALKTQDLSGVDLILSGHVHNFASVSFAGRRPPQLVDGAGGDILDMQDTPPPAMGRPAIDGLPADVFTMGRFGYFVLDRRGTDWAGVFYTLDDRPAATCLLRRRALICRAARPPG